MGKWLNLNLYPLFPSMNLQKQQLLLRLFRYFKSRKGEPRFFNKRNICLLAAAHGIPTVGVAWGYGETADMEAAGAKAIAQTPEHLVELLREM